MKKSFIFFLAFFCAFGIMSCQKSIRSTAQPQSEIATTASGSSQSSHFFDPTALVSASQLGILDTIKKGFAFTEGPAVDKMGNVFFTDQPNDKIYRWDAVTGEVSLF